MPLVYRPWISPYGDDDFEWDRRKSLATFDDRDLVFEAARIVSRLLATAARHAPSPAPDGGPFHGARRVVRPRDRDYLHSARRQVPDHLLGPGAPSRIRDLLCRRADKARAHL